MIIPSTCSRSSSDLNGVDWHDQVMGCTDCRSGEHPTGFAAIDIHLDRVACQTCHIPRIARDSDYPTLVHKDWTDVSLQENGLYAPAMALANDIDPVYRWWNGQAESTPPFPLP